MRRQKQVPDIGTAARCWGVFHLTGKGVLFLPWSKVRNKPGGQQDVSSNYRYYKQKMAERRSCRVTNPLLQGQLHELFVFVMRCEAEWN
jgi:hypothetical protein